MKRRHVVTAALSCTLFLVPLTHAIAQQHHDDAAAIAAVAVAAPAQRWMSDAPLREGMSRVHAAVDALGHYEMGHMSASMAVDQATEVEDAVAFMFANCKLAPEPDAALHGILAPLLSAAQALKADPRETAAVADMRAAIAHYPHYFDDPGWAKPVQHAMHDEP